MPERWRQIVAYLGKYKQAHSRYSSSFLTSLSLLLLHKILYLKVQKHLTKTRRKTIINAD